MKKFTLPFFAILLLLDCVICLSGCDTSKKAQAQIVKDPYITFDNLVHDFGTIKVGEQKTHVYTFTNTFDQDIVLELASGCHCTELEYDEGQTYKPGEKEQLRLPLIVTRRKNVEHWKKQLIFFWKM